MDKAFIGVTINESTIPRDLKPIDWLDRKFIPIEEIWPSWITGRVLMGHLLTHISSFNLMRREGDLSSIAIGFEFPLVQVPAYGMVPYWETFPMEVIKKFHEITEEVTRDYMPNLNKFFQHKMNNGTLQSMRCEIQCRGELIEAERGRHFLREYAFRLGFHEFQLELNPIDIEVKW